ncbi:MAG: PDZ domain-containing protein [Chlamydiota bacterium]|nr:PDZ domain-containing protein [Chlamydiota bacterium]
MSIWFVKRALFSFNLFLAALLVFIGVWLMRSPVHEIDEGSPSLLSPTVPAETRSAHHQSSESPVVSLFGKVKEAVLPYPSVRMRGFATKGNDQYAVIEYRGKQHLVREGDTFEGFQIASITPREVIFDSSQKPQKSKIQRKKIVETVSHWDEILHQVRIIPYNYAENAKGFILLNVRPMSMVEQIGFKSGDVIKSINGHKIQGMGDLVSLYEDLNHSNNLKFDIRRGTKDMQIDYEVTDEMSA